MMARMDTQKANAADYPEAPGHSIVSDAEVADYERRWREWVTKLENHNMDKADDTPEVAYLRAELDRANMALSTTRVQKEEAQAQTATLRGEWLAMKNERDAARQPAATRRAPDHYNDIRLDSYLSSGTWSYQIVATEYHGNEVRINVDPDTLVRFASEALGAVKAASHERTQ